MTTTTSHDLEAGAGAAIETSTVRKKLEDLLTPQELSDYLDVPLGTVYGWRTTGDGPRATKVGRHLRYRVSEVKRYLDERTDDR